MVRKALLLALTITLFTPLCYASKKIAVVYTGNTFSNLYPCACPGAPDGGVARRATVIKDLKKDVGDVLLIENSGIFPLPGHSDAGVLKTKAGIYLDALKKMGYDVLAMNRFDLQAVDDFGLDLSAFTVFSQMVEMKDGNHPVVKEYVLNGQKTLLVFLSQKVIENPTLLDSVFTENSDARYRIGVVSGDVKDRDALYTLLDKFYFPLVFVPAHSLLPKDSEELWGAYNQTLVVAPKWEGKSVVYVELAHIKGEEYDCGVKVIPLKKDIKDDKDVSGVLPVCIEDSDCVPRDKSNKGLIPRCINGGKKDAKCDYEEKRSFNITVLGSRACIACYVDSGKKIEWLMQLFPGAYVKPVDIGSDEGKKLLDTVKAKTLPVIILDEAVDKDKNFYAIEGLTKKTEVGYVLSPEVSGVAMFLDRERIPKRVDLFIRAVLDDESAKYVKVIQDLKKDERFNDWRFYLHFLYKKGPSGWIAPGGEMELNEIKANMCVIKNNPPAIEDFMLCRAEDGYKSLDECLERANVEKDSFEGCYSDKQQYEFMMIANNKLTEELGINVSNFMLFENNQIFGLSPKAFNAEAMTDFFNYVEQNSQEDLDI